MEFKLFYRGQLRANGSPKDKQMIRRAFHPQLKILWNQPPLAKHASSMLKLPSESPQLGLIEQVSGFSFAPLVTSKLYLVAELDILFLRPEEPGKIISQGGDLDNRIKTLFDGLRMPKPLQNEIPEGDTPSQDENPFFCLLEDDSLITRFSVTSDRLLEESSKNEAVLIISVTTRATEKTWLGLEIG